MTVPQLLSLCGSLLALLIGLLAFFGKRLLGQVDAALQTAANDNAALSQQVVALTNSLQANSAETQKLRGEMSTLLRAFSAFDRWIYGEAQHGSFKTPPPDFSKPAT